MSIADFIPTGQANAITRKQLVMLTNLCDRKVRELISQARADGVPILNHQDGRGYYISDNPQEIRRFAMQELSRAATIGAAAVAMSNFADKLSAKGCFAGEF